MLSIALLVTLWDEIKAVKSFEIQRKDRRRETNGRKEPHENPAATHKFGSII